MEECECDDCIGNDAPCHSDCDSAVETLCQGCREALEQQQEQEHDEMCALGYK